MPGMKENVAEEHGLLPARTPLGWRSIPPVNGSHAFERRGGLLVLLSASIERDGRLWLHVSASRRDRVPNYAELCECKRVFVGPDRPAYQVHPRETEHENLHAYCLHLWAPVGFDPLPDFRFDGGGV